MVLIRHRVVQKAARGTRAPKGLSEIDASVALTGLTGMLNVIKATPNVLENGFDDSTEQYFYNGSIETAASKIEHPDKLDKKAAMVLLSYVCENSGLEPEEAQALLTRLTSNMELCNGNPSVAMLMEAKRVGAVGIDEVLAQQGVGLPEVEQEKAGGFNMA